MGSGDVTNLTGSVGIDQLDKQYLTKEAHDWVVGGELGLIFVIIILLLLNEIF